MRMTLSFKIFEMTDNNKFDVIIVGGSYAGLSAAMTLGRAYRNVLIIDSGKPCNRQTPHSHNFLTRDGETPLEIASIARTQVGKYETVKFHQGLATGGTKTHSGFEITTSEGKTFACRKLLFATGIIDIMPEIKGFEECWGISVLHCPYCHGYEVGGKNLGIFSNGEIGFHMSRLISNWTKDLTLLTNGKSTLTAEQTSLLRKHQIDIVEKEVEALEHEKGYLQNIIFKDGTKSVFAAVFSKLSFKQHSDIPTQLGCELTEQGFLKTDDYGKTSVPGIYAAGDNTSFVRSVSVSVAGGTKAGAFLNHEMLEEDF
jgi:thioredoxin reductase